MKKTNIIGLLAIFLLIFSLGVSAATLTRTAQSSVNPGSTFSVTYATSGTSGKYFVAWEDSITGGCTPSTYKSFIGSESGIGESKSVTFTAPSSGSCTFNGYYQYTSENKQNFPSLTVNIGTIPTCTDTCTSGTKQCTSTTSYQTCGNYDSDSCLEWSSAISCASGVTCSNGNCGDCIDTCSSKGFTCGTQTICSSSVNCGTCNTGYTCTNGQCISSGGCTSGQSQACTDASGCIGTQTCSNSVWGTCTSALTKCSDGTCKTDCGTTPPTWDLNQVIFYIGTFGVTWMYLIIAAILALIIGFMK